jgi:glycerophosphoryl diester phosphodiesterase
MVAPETLLVAHRGASGVAPENTLAAIDSALRTTADLIEIDIHQTRDGQVVVLHDATLDRTTDGRGKVGELTLEQVRALDAGAWFGPAFAGLRVPTLEEVIRRVSGQKKLLIEIKSGDGLYLGIEARTVEQVQQHGAQEWCFIQSFHDEVLTNVQRADSSLAVYKLIVGKVPLLPVFVDKGLRFGSLRRYRGLRGINVYHRFASRSFIRQLQGQGFQTIIWTIDDPDWLERIARRGADGVMTNYPGQVRRSR